MGLIWVTPSFRQPDNRLRLRPFLITLRCSVVEHRRLDLDLLVGTRSGFVSAGYLLRSVWRRDSEPVFLARGDERLSVDESIENIR
jgi:hypothetical protein